AGTGSGFTLKKDGNIGIGTSNPLHKLDVAGRIQANDELIVTKSNIDIGGTISLVNGAKTEPGQASVWRIFNMGGSNGNSLQFWAYDNIGCTTGGLCNNRFTIMDDGKVGIGTSAPDEMLTVNGKIHAKEVIVALTGPLADYVFEPDYRLKPLHEVEQFVKANKHLPGIPSAAQVKEKGLSMGEMQNKLLQKIEELTLYIIEQQKQIEELKKSVAK
ncbi:MAG: tail fiber protein, partial [Bacteroidaceae bacterium]|nr:tail fiber protein [Bacteroidaceae bacterium]